MSKTKVFLDTNIFMEYIEEREHFSAVNDIFKAIADKKIEAIISTGGLYTMTYLITLGFKRNGIHKPEQTTRLRQALNQILKLAKVCDTSHTYIQDAINDSDFDDIEDSYQYYCAKENNCDFIITINIKDFKGKDSTKFPKVIMPEDFVSKSRNTSVTSVTPL